MVKSFSSKYGKSKIKAAAIIALVLLMATAMSGCDMPASSGEQSSDFSYLSSITSGEDEFSSVASDPSSQPVSSAAVSSDGSSKPAYSSAPASSPTSSSVSSDTPVHLHSYAAATCTEPATCDCGETQGAANGHNWKDATCTKPKTCTICGETQGAANGHNWKDATYTAPKTCTVCGATQGSALEVPGNENYHGHVYTGGQYSKKYHYEAQCAGKNSHEITWAEVERRGLEPCGTCVLK